MVVRVMDLMNRENLNLEMAATVDVKAKATVSYLISQHRLDH